MANSHAHEDENERFSNPCGYDTIQKTEEKSGEQYQKDLARKIAKQANYSITIAKSYSQELAMLHGFRNDSQDPELDVTVGYKAMLKDWHCTKWLHKHKGINSSQFWALPNNKMFGEKVEDQVLTEVLSRLNEALPIISKVLKILAAELEAIKNSGFLEKDESLKVNLQNSSDNIISVLCYCHDMIIARDLKMLPLYDSEITHPWNESDTIKSAFLVHRDTINFLEFLDQLFTKMDNSL